MLSLFGFILLGVLFGIASGSIIGGLVAGLIPTIYFWVVADDKMQDRKERISREFPCFLDLVVMTRPNETSNFRVSMKGMTSRVTTRFSQRLVQIVVIPARISLRRSVPAC
ncbi:hypothetical protein JOH51_005879 [Rhizobium leguminosarum]|nr:hypothetical protein [Rhizobium leguminosarum]